MVPSDHQLCQQRNEDGSPTDFSSGSTSGPAGGQRHEIDCIDCHHRPAHCFDTLVDALNKDMAAGSPYASLPFVHKQGLTPIRASYASSEEATAQITSGRESFYPDME